MSIMWSLLFNKRFLSQSFDAMCYWT